MITLEEVLSIHHVLVEKFGGAEGVKDQAVPESAINRPYSTFDTVELYPTPVEKAAAVVESIVKNHPFVDGNKRTGYVLMRLFLIREGHDVKATEDEKYDFIISIAEGTAKIDDIKNWISERVV